LSLLVSPVRYRFLQFCLLPQDRGCLFLVIPEILPGSGFFQFPNFVFLGGNVKDTLRGEKFFFSNPSSFHLSLPASLFLLMGMIIKNKTAAMMHR